MAVVLLLAGTTGTFGAPSLVPPIAPVHLGELKLTSAPASVRPGANASPIVSGATILGVIAVKDQPTVATYDSRDQYLYVTNFGAPTLGGNTVSIVADGNDTVLKTVAVGDDPLTSVYNSATGYVYVLNFGTSNNLTVFNGRSIIKWIPTGITPSSGLYDPYHEYVYITNQASNNLTVLNGTTTVASVPVGAYPGRAAFDTRNDWVYVPNSGTDNVTIVNGTTVVGSVNVGQTPASVIYDAGNGWMYVPNPLTNNVTILNGTSVVATVAGGGSPSYGAYDPDNGFVYLADAGSNTVYVLNGTSFVANISVGVFPRSVEFDAADGFVYVPDWSSNEVTVINGSTIVASVAVGINPFGSTYDPGNSAVYVVNYNSANLTKLGTPAHSYPVTFAETGLPNGTSWSVDYNSSSYPTTASQVGFPEANGTSPYELSTVPGFSAIVPSGQVVVAGAPVQVNVSFARAYPVTFQESHLPPGTFWAVSIGSAENGTGNSSAQLWEPNGTYNYSIQPVIGFATTWSGSVQILGAGVLVPVVFTQTVYPVWFNETGLKAGTVWGASLGNQSNSSGNASFVIDEPNGSYLYGLAPVLGYSGTPSVGYLSVNGAQVVERVTFVWTYAVTFDQSGLPHGTNWTVTLGTGPVTTNASTLTVALANGTYSFGASTSLGTYAPVAARGTFNVSGAATNVLVAYAARGATATSYWLYFAESGLLPPATWTVTLGNQTNESTNGSIGFVVHNATYAFQVSSVGYVADPSSGSVVANGAGGINSPLRVAFRAYVPPIPPSFGVTFTAAGLPPGFAWQVRIGSSVASGVEGSLVVSEPNGTYAFVVGPTPGYAANRTGAVTVSGGAKAVIVTFTTFTVPILFVESGLPLGTSWNVTLGPGNGASSGPVIGFSLPNGTYSFGVGAVPGFANSGGGTVMVNGSAPVVVDVRFGSPTTSASTVFGLPPWEALGLAALGALLLVVVGALVPLRRRPTETEPEAIEPDLVSNEE
ncbi:MAG: YncE family protein [Thermoplasmata archaeon]|nr:YncE family protein [Thermoplasmata archaeon]